MTDTRVPDDWVVVAETADEAEASLLEGRLREEEIEVMVLQGRTAPGAWLTGSQPGWTPRSIAVPVADSELALSVLAEVSDAPSEADVEEYGMPETIAARRRFSFMEAMRASAWIITALVALSLAFAQCGVF